VDSIPKTLKRKIGILQALCKPAGAHHRCASPALGATSGLMGALMALLTTKNIFTKSIVPRMLFSKVFSL
jgi:hypothetical protein